ncbi:hypothetical protein LUZ60_005232 [Juncus effusus]|nr:hypothetical protein LUZ60_005232 [Juncus effusus]
MASENLCSIIEGMEEMLSTLPPPSIAASSENSSPTATEDLKRLEATMKRIRTVLLDAGDRHIRDRSEKRRLEELKEVALDAEDLVEDYAYEVLHAKIEARNSVNSGSGEHKEVCITDLSSVDVSVAVSEEVAVRSRGIRERFDEIIKEWKSLRWMESDGVWRQHGLGMARRSPTCSLIDEFNVHGRHQDRENIIEELFLGYDKYNSIVLPIVGMGGVGKTTLARLVYNDPRVCAHFDLRSWVCVSVEFDVKSIMEAIIESLTNKPCGLMQFDTLQIALQEKVKGKKFLLVLDDVWNESPSIWHSLRAPLFHLSQCMIIVTTRNENVAKIMQTTHFYPLHCLDAANSWRLFMQVAFESRDPSEHGSLVEIGKEVTIKCGGLPLAVKAIGGALNFELDEEIWRDVLESDLWELEAGKTEVLPALQLSYDCMPMHLKQCFMFLSLFPKDYMFSRDMIIKLWSSVGFLQQSKHTKSVHGIGSVYFDDLLQRSMVQKVQFDEKTCIYTMHDLMHKLAEFVAEELFSRVENLKNFSSRKLVRYLTVVVNDLPKIIDLMPMRRLNSLRVFQVLNTANKWMSKDISIIFHEGFFENFQCLRAVDFSYTGITNLPDSIGNLKQLRYLSLAKTYIKSLPETICLLYNLQTLNLLECPLQTLPKNIKNLVNLQHLIIIAKWSTISAPHGIGHLTNLVTLPAFNMDGHSNCNISELKNLKNLHGDLCITGLDSVQHVTDVVLADLQNKKYINCLTLDWSSDGSKTQNHSSCLISNESCELVLAALKPQENLQVLEIYRYPGLSYPRWLGDISYSKLVQIVLFGNRDVSCRTYLPALGRLPSLTNLSVQCMLNVEIVSHEFCCCDAEIKGFRSLTTLEFRYMPRWVQWLGFKNDEFSSLSTLKMIRCNALKYLPPKLSVSLTKLVINHCKELAELPFLPSLTSLILMGQINKLLFLNMRLPSLESLEVGFSRNLSVIPLYYNSLQSLKVLIIKRCINLENVVGLSNLRNLTELELDGCHSLMLSHGFRKDVGLPPFLQELRISNCRNLHNCTKSNFEDKPKKVFEEANFQESKAHDENMSKNEEYVVVDTNSTYQLGDDLIKDYVIYYGDSPPPPSRKRHKKISNQQLGSSFSRQISLDDIKGKQINDYSSGSSVGRYSDSYLVSFGGTSEEGTEEEIGADLSRDYEIL